MAGDDDGVRSLPQDGADEIAESGPFGRKIRDTPAWWNGIHGRLKIVSSKGDASSTLAAGTTHSSRTALDVPIPPLRGRPVSSRLALYT